jgi:hypothetical protein
VLLLFNRIYAQIAYTNYVKERIEEKELILAWPYKSAIFTLLVGAELDVRLEEATHQGDADLVLRHAGKVTLFAFKVSRTGTEDDVGKRLGEAVAQMRKYKGPHEVSVPIGIIVDGTRRRIALASVLDKVYAFAEQGEDGTPATFAHVCDTDGLPLPPADEASG